MKDKKLKVKLIRSVIGCNDNQKANIIGLGFKKVGDEKELINTPAVRGMVKKMINWLEVKQ